LPPTPYSWLTLERRPASCLRTMSIFSGPSGWRRAHGYFHGAQELSIGDVIRGLTLIVQVLDADEMINHVEFL